MFLGMFEAVFRDGGQNGSKPKVLGGTCEILESNVQMNWEKPRG